MDSFVCDFYIYDNLHRLEVLASPWKSVQKIYVDSQLVVEYTGKLVNRYMLYSIEVENMPITVSIHDCGLCCEFNAYLDNTSIVDGSRLDARKKDAEKIIDGGFKQYLLSHITDYFGKSWLILLVFIALYTGLVGFSLMAISSALIAYVVGLVAAAWKDFVNVKQVVNKWFAQYQQWQK